MEIGETDSVRVAKDAGSARWVIDGFNDRGVCGILPTGFQAYARILHPAWRCVLEDGHLTRKPTAWAEVAVQRGRSVHRLMQWFNISALPIIEEEVIELLVKAGYEIIDAPDEGTLTPLTAKGLLRVLERYTQNPGTCWFGVWEGFGWEYKPGLGKPQSVGNSFRAWDLFRGPLQAIERSFFDAGEHQSANLVWPEDKSWCIATEISLHSTYVGGSNKLIASILDNDELEAHVALPGDDLFYDKENPPLPSRGCVIELRHNGPWMQ